MTEAMQVQVFEVVVAFNAVAMTVLGFVLVSFRRTIDRLDLADKDLTHRVSKLEVTVAHMDGAYGAIGKQVEALAAAVDRLTNTVDAKFAEYDRNIRDFYAKYDLPIKR
jgi:uncharacterized coiled-coil protein SlyX